MSTGLQPDEVRLVLARAAALEDVRAAEVTLTSDEVVAVAEEAGLDPDAVRRALSELAAHRQPGVAAVERDVPRAARSVNALLDCCLGQQGFVVRRRHERRTRWVRRHDPIGGLRAAIHPGAGVPLREVRRLDAEIVGDDRRSHVRLTADLRGHRRMLRSSAVTVPLMLGGTLVLGSLSFGAPIVAAFAGGGAAASSGTSWMLFHRALQRRTEDVAERLETLLDWLEG